MLKDHEFSYVANRKRQAGSRLGRLPRLGRGDHINGYRVQLIRSGLDRNVDFLIDPDRKIEHEDKIEMLWVR